MAIDTVQIQLFADLGNTWLHEQTARILQRHLQFGQHRQIDLDDLLSRAARPVRASLRKAANERLWRATVDAVEHRERFVSIDRDTGSEALAA